MRGRMEAVFGTDGVRGAANVELTPDLALGLARAVVGAVAPGAMHPQLLVARDTRRSGDLLAAAVAAGVCSAGADILFAGVLPTPALAWLVGRLGLAGGIMVSASHNPARDNGLKFFGPGGHKLTPSQEAALERALSRPVFAEPEQVGRIEEAAGLRQRYLDHLLAAAPARLEGLRVVVDCAHGALCELAPRLLTALGAKAIPLNCAPDGENINQGGAVNPAGMAQAVRRLGADVGLAFDGDGDRVVLADERGELVDGDQVLAVWAQDLERRGQLAHHLVVGTVISNGGLEELLHELGCRLVRAPVGDRHVAEEMRRRGAALGGEACGHVIHWPHLSSSDGLWVGLNMLALMARSQRPLSELTACLRRRPQAAANVPVADCAGWEHDPLIRAAIAEAERELAGSRGWLVIRTSGTEPVIRVTVECEEEAEARRILRQVTAAIQHRIRAQEDAREARPVGVL